MALCAVCSAPATSRCGGCKRVSYCSRKHQTQHWKVHKKKCSAVAVKCTPTLGTHLVATRNLKAGELVFEEVPTITTFQWDEAGFGQCHMCLSCANKIHPLTRCPTCGWPVCGDQCGQALVHAENECKVFAQRDIPYPPPPDIQENFMDLLFFIRITNLKKTQPLVYQNIMKLHDNPENRGDVSYAPDKVLAFFRYLPTLLNIDVSDEELRKLFRIGRVNMFAIKMQASIFYLFLKCSYLNHSCVSNCTLATAQYSSTNSSITRIRACDAILKGEALFVNYLEIFEPLQGTRYRQKWLRETYELQCTCRRCIDPTELGTYFSAVVCSKCNLHPETITLERGQDARVNDPNKGYILPVDPLDVSELAPWRCNSCGHTMTAFGVDQINVLIEEKLKECPARWSEMVQFQDHVFIPFVQKLVHPNHYSLYIVTKQLHEHFRTQLRGKDDIPRVVVDSLEKRFAFLKNIADQLCPGTRLQAEILHDLSIILELLILRVDQQFSAEETKARLRTIIGLQEDALNFFQDDSPPGFCSPDHQLLIAALSANRCKRIILENLAEK